tara:strand:+ start:736 stop:1023 length:288 start_codon:yes stop_codon:yes gene_type:complete
MKAYWIAVYKDIKGVENLKHYAEKASVAINRYSGRILVRGGKTETIEGQPSPRTVLIEFPSMKEALDCYNSKDYQSAKKIGGYNFNRHLQIVEGI